MIKSNSKKPTKAAKAVRATAKNSKTKSKKFSFSTLRMINFFIALLLTGQAVALVLLSNKDRGDVSVTADYLTRDPVVSGATGQTVLAPATDQLLSLNLAYLVASFLALGAIASLLMATRLRRRYEANLKSSINPARWVTFIFSYGALLLTAALMSGATDIVSLMMLLAFSVVAAVLALNAEKQNQLGLKTWHSKLAFITGLVPVAVIALYIFMAHIYGGGLPVRTLVAVGVLGLGLLISLLALKNAYRVNTKTFQYLAIERTYLIFAFLVPTAFAWVIFSLLLK